MIKCTLLTDTEVTQISVLIRCILSSSSVLPKAAFYYLPDLLLFPLTRCVTGEPSLIINLTSNRLSKLENPETVKRPPVSDPETAKHTAVCSVLTHTEFHHISVIGPGDNQVNKQDRYPIQNPFTAPQCMRGGHF